MKKTQFLKVSAAPLALGLALISAPAFAQDAAADQAEEATADTGDAIVVTGTLIRNPNLQSSSPVNVTTSDEIQLRQTNVAEEILRDVPGVAANIGSSVNNGNGGASFVDLRGLGPNRNIVVLDGHRIVPANLNGNVDLNNIPLALVDRVDVLTGGASTTYGADAVSGVVNFVTKRDFSGVDFSTGYQITDRGDGKVFRTDLVVGANFDDGRGNAVLSIGYQEADPVYFGGDRPRSDLTIDSFDGSGNGASSTAVPSRFSINDVGFRQIDPASGNLVPQYARFNFNPYNIFQTPFKRYNIFSSARYEVSDSVEVFARGMFSQNTVNTIIAPSGAFSSPVFIPLNNPYMTASARNTFCANNDFDGNPDNGVQTLTAAQCAAAATATGPNDPNYQEVATNLGRRLIEAGPRISSYKTQLFDIMAGVRGSITDNLRYEISGNYGESENTQTILNYVSLSRMQQALRANNTTECFDSSKGCVPVNVFGAAGSITPDMVKFLLVPATSGNTATLLQTRGILSGDLMSVSEGAEPVSFAVGVEYRKYEAGVFADQLAQDPGELGGAGGATVPVEGGYSVREAFAEIIAPLIADAPFFNELTLEAGVRYSDYKIDAPGNPKFDTWTWKGGLTWSPVESLKLRGNYQRAVRAPNIGELFTPNSVGLLNLKNDPCQNPGYTAPTAANPNPDNSGAILGTSVLGQICAAQGAPITSSGYITAIEPPSAGQINASFSFTTDNKPEKADTWTLGAVFQPEAVRNLSLSVDYYNIKINNALSAPTVGDILAKCFGTMTAASATSVACTSIRRDPTTGGLDGDPSVAFGVPQPLTNSGRFATDGIDIAANWKTDLTDEIQLALGFSGNYTLHSKFRAEPGGLNRECVGYYSINCTSVGSILPKFSFNQRTTLSYGDIDVSLLWRHISGTKQEPYDADESNFGSNGPAFAAFQKIDAYDWFDLTTRFDVTENFELTMSVMNMFDKKPPTVGSNIGSTTFNSGNTYPSTYDAIGRRYAVGARVKF